MIQKLFVICSNQGNLEHFPSSLKQQSPVLRWAQCHPRLAYKPCEIVFLKLFVTLWNTLIVADPLGKFNKAALLCYLFHFLSLLLTFSYGFRFMVFKIYSVMSFPPMYILWILFISTLAFILFRYSLRRLLQATVASDIIECFPHLYSVTTGGKCLSQFDAANKLGEDSSFVCSLFADAL